MKLDIIPVGPQLRPQVLALEVAPGQEGFLEPVSDCLAEADQLPLWRPVALCREGTVVGFAMYGLFPDEGEGGRVWLDRLMIAAPFQGQGLGCAALTALMAHLQEEYGRDCIYLSVVPENEPAAHLYRRFGFAPNGERDCKGEVVMCWKKTCSSH